MAAPAKKPTEPIQRDTVNIGLDFNPIPLNVGDGKIWYFSSQADAAQLDRLISLGREIAKFEGLTTDEANSVEFSAITEKISGALIEVLVKPAQRKEWAEANYGPIAQAAVSAALIKQWSGGFPTM